MTIDEAIKHCEEVMMENLEKTKDRNASDPIAINCFECAEEHRQLAEWLKDYKRLLEQDPSYNSIKTELEPCEDAVSRQAVIDAITKTSGIRGDTLKALYDLPSVTPQPKVGHWIFDEILDKHYYCSECKSMGVDYWDFCPNCGAKMQEVEE